MLREDFHLLAQRKTPQLRLSLAQNKAEIRAAQRLRLQVLSAETGTHLRNPPANIEPQLDQDLFDSYCEHLLLRDHASGALVGTCRLLNPKMAQRAGGYSSETEFDLTRLSHLQESLVEVGRSCIHPDYRNGAAMGLLWSGVIQYMQQMDYVYLMSCASIGVQDGGHAAASIYRRLSQEHLSPREWRVFPRYRLPLESLNSTLNAALPPQIKGYLKLGCFICGEPAWDANFNRADLLLLLPLSLMNKPYVRHYFDPT